MSFREKSAWISIVAVVLVYGFYGLRLLHAPPTQMGAVAMLIGSTFLVIVINVIGHVAAAAWSQRREHPDERDRLIGLRSTRVAFHALAAGVWGLIFLALASPRPVLLAYAALGAFVLADIVRLGSQLVMYRTQA